MSTDLIRGVNVFDINYDMLVKDLQRLINKSVGRRYGAHEANDLKSDFLAIIFDSIHNAPVTKSEFHDLIWYGGKGGC